MGLSFFHLVVVLVVVLILFGAGRLPNVMGDLGRGLRAFKDGLHGEEGEKKDPPPPQIEADKKTPPEA
jgi:sec-independent protein translocase protein TatA